VKTIGKHLAFNAAFWFMWWVFLGLQLSGAIHWSWWAVTGPLWLVGAGFAVYVGIAVSIALSTRNEFKGTIERFWH
jgi:hypothetical protein